MFDSQKIIAAGLQADLDEVKVAISDSKTFALDWEDNKIVRFASEDVTYVNVAGVKNGNESSVSAVGFDESKIPSLIESIKRNIEYKTRETKISYLSPAGLNYLQVSKNPFSPLSVEKATKLIDSLGKAINASDKRIRAANTNVYYQYSFRQSNLANSKGLNLTSETGSVFWIYVAIFASVGANSSTFFLQNAYRDINEYSEQALVDEAKKLISQRLIKQDFETKNYEIVFAPGVFSELFDELTDHFNARSIIDKRSNWADKLEKKVASEKLTIIDSPIVPEIGLYKIYDSDGNPTRIHHIIEQGTLKTIIQSENTAKIMKTISTGNAAGSNPSPHCLYVKKGILPPQQVIKQVQDGMYITALKGFHSASSGSSGDFSLEIEGNLIVDGKIKKAIKAGIWSGNAFRDVLNNVKEVANDVNFSKGHMSPTILLNKAMPITK